MIPKILDCTLRDGGYYNNWDFPDKSIQRYLDACSSSDSISIIEFGYRSLLSEGFRGACAFSSDTFLNRFRLSDTIQVAIMINASEFSDLDQQSFDKNFDILFPNTSLSSPVSIVRIATHLKNLDVSEIVLQA